MMCNATGDAVGAKRAYPVFAAFDFSIPHRFS
jgi:hypothetical protein